MDHKLRIILYTNSLSSM